MNGYSPWEELGIDELAYWKMRYLESQESVWVLEDALRLIAAPKRSDGTYNRCRETCEILAREALKKFEGDEK